MLSHLGVDRLNGCSKNRKVSENQMLLEFGPRPEPVTVGAAQWSVALLNDISLGIDLQLEKFL